MKTVLKRSIKLLVIAISVIIFFICIISEEICVQAENIESDEARVNSFIDEARVNSFINEENIVDLVVMSLIKGDTELLYKMFPTKLQNNFSDVPMLEAVIVNSLSDLTNAFDTYFDNELGNGWDYTYSVEIEQPYLYNNENYNLEDFNKDLYDEYEMITDEAKWIRTSIVVSSKDLKKSETFTLNFSVFKDSEQWCLDFYNLIWDGDMFYRKEMNEDMEPTVEVTVNGENYGTYLLNEDAEVHISVGEGENILKIEDGYADMVAADCPNQICVNTAPIHLDGETIVCLPHKVVVQIKSRIMTCEEPEVDAVTN